MTKFKIVPADRLVQLLLLKTSHKFRLFVVSLLILFAEVMCIRWFAVEIPLLRIFPNLTLMVIFIGVSVGLSTYKKPQISQPTLILATVGTLACIILAKPLHLQALSLQSSLGIMLSLLFLGIVVLNLTAVFICLGRVLGLEFGTLPALKAYLWNLLGSLCGVILFALISFFGLPPTVWVLIVALLTFVLTDKKYVLAFGLILSMGAAVAYQGSSWSPYSYIQILPNHQDDRSVLGAGSYSLYSNGDFFHGGAHIVPVSSYQSIGELYKSATQWQRYYRYWLEVPYLLAHSWDNVLVLGAGSGNDVQAALEHGAKHVDAIEIDPYIATCGRKIHPDHPYANADKVDVHVEDARTFLRYADKKYNLIQFAYLDPGRTLRVSSFLRSDNFVYTKESLKSAIDHLTPDGIVTLSFATGGDALATRRLYETISEAYGKPPLAFVQDYTGSCFFFFGPGLKPVPDNILAVAGLRFWPGQGEFNGTRGATDDWPFLYLDFTGAAAYIYFFVLSAAALLPLTVLIKGLSGKLVPTEAVPMFFLGMAFMLMETKSITALSLLFGSTWIVSSIVITVILLLACLANWLADTFNFNKLTPWYVCLVLALLLDYWFRVPTSSTLHPIMLAMVSATICCLPVFFGSTIFSILLKRSKEAVLPLSANVMGVAFGGLLENMCIVSGIHSLSLLALALYLLSAVPLLFARSKQKS